MFSWSLQFFALLHFFRYISLESTCPVSWEYWINGKLELANRMLIFVLSCRCDFTSFFSSPLPIYMYCFQYDSCTMNSVCIWPRNTLPPMIFTQFINESQHQHPQNYNLSLTVILYTFKLSHINLCFTETRKHPGNRWAAIFTCKKYIYKFIRQWP